jgi:hypothetical protein
MVGPLRRVAIAFALVLLCLAAAPPVGAAKPDREFAPAADVLVSGLCDFDVLVEVLVNKEYTTAFYDRDGNVVRIHIAGRLVNRLTNTTTGEAIEVDVSGPGVFLVDEEGLTVEARGRWLLFFAGEFVIVSGNTVLRVDSTGESIVSRNGSQIDVCSLLGG